MPRCDAHGTNTRSEIDGAMHGTCESPGEQCTFPASEHRFSKQRPAPAPLAESRRLSAEPEIRPVGGGPDDFCQGRSSRHEMMVPAANRNPALAWAFHAGRATRA